MLPCLSCNTCNSLHLVLCELVHGFEQLALLQQVEVDGDVLHHLEQQLDERYLQVPTQLV